MFKDFANFFKKLTSTDNSNNNSIKKKDTITLLVILDDPKQNFYELFHNCKLSNGRSITIHQAGWKDLRLTSYSNSLRSIVSIVPHRKPHPNTSQNRGRTIQPDFLLIRELCRGVKVTQDFRNQMLAFMVSQTPSLNSLYSIYCMNERPLMISELIRLHRKFGQKKFPIFEQAFYPMHEEMMITPQYPIVVKVGHGHAGYGKIKLTDHHQFSDVKSIVATTAQYCTAEKYIEGKYDLRLQKIGDNYQAYKRTNMSGNWKTNTGTSFIEMIEVLPRYKFWMDECCAAFGGGLEICTVDVLVSAEDDSEYILEFNGTASGFGNSEEDNIILRDYVIRKLNEYFVDGNINEQKYLRNQDLIKMKDVVIDGKDYYELNEDVNVNGIRIGDEQKEEKENVAIVEEQAVIVDEDNKGSKTNQ